MIDLQRAKRKLAPDGGCLFFDGGGAGNSSNQSVQRTENADMRVVGGDSSVNTSNKIGFGDNATGVTVTTTDFGAVNKSLDLALRGIEGQQQITQQAVSANGSILDSALHTVGAQQEQFTSAIENIKTGNKTLLIGGAIVVLALGAAMWAKKG